MSVKFITIRQAACLFLLLALLIGSPRPGAAQDYILGEGDMITVSVYEQPDLKTTARISGDGMITMPLIGQVAAADLSVSKLSSKIEGLLADGYLVDPQVNIFIEEFRSRKVTILGQVNSPGVYEIKGQTTLLELISQADGLTPDAAERAVIHRKKPGQKGSNKDEKAMQVDLARLMEEGRSSENIFVVDGDNIYIPKKEVFYVSGEVEKPDVYNYEKGLTVIKALTMAGGANEIAAPGRIKIIRIRDGKEHLIKDVKMGMKVRPNDVIVVPESYF